MGCGPSKFDLEYSRNQRSYAALKLSKSAVKRLWNVFQNVDTDHRGTISFTEFLMYFDLDKSLFVRRAFDILDEDASGAIGFLEFVVGLWNYCTLDRTAMLLFAFDMFDLDSTGEIDGEEMTKSLLEVYGNNKKHQAMIKKTKDEIDRLVAKTGHGITQARFVDFAKHHSNLLFPVFDLQKRLREKAGGTGFWDDHTGNRDQSAGIGGPTTVLSRVAPNRGGAAAAGPPPKGRAVAPATGPEGYVASQGMDHSLTAGRAVGHKGGNEGLKVLGSVADRRAARLAAHDYTEEQAAVIKERVEDEAEFLKETAHGSGFRHHTGRQTDEDIAAVKIQSVARRKAAEKRVESARSARSPGGSSAASSVRSP